ncbi:uncharacterized protein LOC110244845 [Exaiptasia diaphana]|uniref:Uncharacterized protein n=1 Tax=Exaiptasia diaphana TaxID=2652724 RepID=A0A913XMH3_EXADI|nr:uncharacterized protein LOC110244845 [Exaiptasia diaphana]
MADKIIAAGVILLCATMSRGVPLMGVDSKTTARVARSEATHLLPFLIKTHEEFEKQNFKNQDYDHHVLLKGIKQVTNFETLSVSISEYVDTQIKNRSLVFTNHHKKSYKL